MKKSLLYFLTFAILFLTAFRSLIFNLSTHLMDWLDYPYIVWVMFQSIEKLKSLDFAHFFETNAFFPYKLTLLFSDILLTQSLIALPFSFFTSNPILVFNIVFIITFFLNYISSFLFWKQIFKKDLIGFMGAIFTVFSPFTHSLLGHFQMLSFWPYFFALYFLVKNEQQKKFSNIIFVGIFLAIQFLASVYLAAFLVASILIYFGNRILTIGFSEKDLRNALTIIVFFILLDGVFIKGYADMSKMYQRSRDLGEYITYSAHLSDYLFTTNMQSLVHQSALLRKWNFFDKHSLGEKTMFPGFLLAGLALWTLFSFKRSKKSTRLSFEIQTSSMFFFTLLITGLIFSFGPRLNFNGMYAHIPSIYAIVLKIPFFNAIRSLARWSFLFYIGVIYFALLSVSKQKRKYVILLVLVVFFLEYFPINIKTHKEEYITPKYTLLKKICLKEKKPLLEIPVTHLDYKGGIIDGLRYVTRVELVSLYHGCKLINGYSGYDLPPLFGLQSKINRLLASSVSGKLVDELVKNQVKVVKFNREGMDRIALASYQKILPSFTENEKIKHLAPDLFLID